MDNALTDSQTDNLGALPNSSWGSGKANSAGLLASVPIARDIEVGNSCFSSSVSPSGGPGIPGRALLFLLLAAVLYRMISFRMPRQEKQP